MRNLWVWIFIFTIVFLVYLKINSYEENTTLGPKDDIVIISQSKKASKVSQNSKKSNKKGKNSSEVIKAKQQKTQYKTDSPHFKTWEALLRKFLEQEYKIKEKLIPLMEKVYEWNILKKYLPEVYTPSFYKWYMTSLAKQWKDVDPLFPILKTFELLHIEKETEKEAIVIVRILADKRRAKIREYRLYQIFLVFENKRWVVDLEKIVKKDKVSGVQLKSRRNILGYFQIKPILDLASPQINTKTERDLLNSLINIARYLQNERNKKVSKILPSLVPKLKPLLSKRYYQDLEQRLKPKKVGIAMKIKSFVATKAPGTMGKKIKDASFWLLTMETFRAHNQQKFRPYQYYLVLKKKPNWRVNLVIARQIERYPRPRPLFYNFMNWELP